MGRKTDVLLRGFRAAKCLTCLKLATARIKVIRNKRSISAKQMRGEIAQLLKSGQDAHVYITKADALIKQENMVAVFDIIDQYCHAIVNRFPMIEMQSNCPIDMKEPIASLIFAAPRCVELSELATIKEAFTAKYGKEFAAAAAELRPDCGVNKQVIELLSTRPATGDMKLKIMKEICVEHNVNWTPGAALAENSTNTPAGSSQQPVKAKEEAAKITGGGAGSSKVTLVQGAPSRVNEAGPSNMNAGAKSAFQGGSQHGGGVNESGPAAMAPLKHGVFATDASKSSGAKHGLSPEEDVRKANASVLQSLKGAVNTGVQSIKSGLATAGSLKTGDGAVFAANIFKKNDTKEEGTGSSGLTGLQNFKGAINTGTSSAISGSFKGSKGESVAKAEAYVQPVVDAHDGTTDSDDDSFVSVEDGRFEDVAEVSSMEEAARRESFGKKSLQASVEADANKQFLIKQPSREAHTSSPSTERPHEGVYSKATSKKSSFAMESSPEDKSLKASSKNSSNTEPFRAESRKNSVRVEESSVLIMDSSHEDIYLRASSKNSSNNDMLPEEKASRADSQKSSLREKIPAAQQSFKEVKESNLMMQLLEEQHFEGSEEGVQRKDSSKDESLGDTTESSVPQTLGAAYPFQEWQNSLTAEDGLQGKGLVKDASTTESAFVENLVEMKKISSFSDGVSAEEIPFGAGEEVAGKEASLNSKKSPESVSKQVDDVPPIGNRVPEIVGSASSGGAPDDFAAAAKAIAAEAARLAVLDYAKRIAGSGAVPVDLTDLTKFGLDFIGPQETKKLHSKNKSELADGGDIRSNVIKEGASKVEMAANDAEGISMDHAAIDEVGYVNMKKSMHSETLIADDGPNGSNASSITMGHTGTLTKSGSLQQPHMDAGNDDINPFATEVDKATESVFSETGEGDTSSWVNKTKPELISNAGGYGQEEDHLDVFFKRKAPMFDEDGYGFVKVNPSFLGEKVPYFGYDKKEHISQEKFFASTPAFDSFAERQSMRVEESSGSFKVPVFDEGVPEGYDASFSVDDGLDRSMLSVGLSDQRRPQLASNVEASPSFDPEPEPSFDKAADEEEHFSIEKMESTQAGQLKWQSKKPEKASEEASNAADASVGGTGNPLSRRTRKQLQSADEYAYGSEILAQAKRPQGSSSSLMEQQRKEQGRYDATEKGNLRTKPADSFAYSSNAMGKRPSRSPDRVSNQYEFDFSKVNQSDNWDSTSSVEDRFSTIRKKSPRRSSRQQEVPLEESDEDFYFAEVKSNSSAGSRISRTAKSPTRVAKQQFLPQGYDDDDNAEGYKFNNRPSRIPNFSAQDLADDDSIEEQRVARYKPSRHSNDLGIGTSANSATYRQKPYRQQEDYKSEPMYMQYVQVDGGGKSNPTSRQSARRKPQDVAEEEDLTSAYKQSTSSRPLSSRTRIEEEDQYLASRYNPSVQVDDLGRVSLSPLSQRQQRYRLSQEEEEEVSMERFEQEEFYPMRQQGDHLREKQRMPRPHYGQKQDVILEKVDSDSSMEDYEQEQEEQRHSSMLSEQEKQRRRLAAYAQEMQHHSSPLLQEYEREERLQRPLYGRKQDLRMEKESLDTTIEDYEEQEEEERRPSILLKHELDGQKKQHRPLPPNRQEKQRRPSPPSYDQEEEVHSLPLPDWRQEERHKEKERMSRPLYGWKQDSRLEKENSDLSMEDYKREQSRQEKQCQRLPPHGQEKGHQPQPPLQQYEEEEEKEELYPMPSSNWGQEEGHKEKERILGPPYGQNKDSRLEKAHVNLSIEDYQQQQEEQQRTSLLSEQEQDGQEKQHQSSPPYGRRRDSKLGKDISETWQQEKIRQEQERLSSDRWQQQSLAEEAAKKLQQVKEKKRLPSPVNKQQQEVLEEKKSSELSVEHHEQQREEWLPQSTAMPEGKQEQDGQGNERRPWPSRSRKQESKLEKESSESWLQQEVLYTQQDEPTFGRKQQTLAKEEGVKGQQEKSENKEQLPAIPRLPKDQGAKGLQEKSETKTQPPARQPPSLPAQSTSPPLESSISDPVILATIPPPVKKPSLRPAPAATTLESSGSAPSPTSIPEVKDPKVPQRPPNVEDLLANFEALRRARKGE